MNNPKIAFFDIDGTMVGLQNHCMVPSTHRALAALRQQGIKLVVSSGRHPVSMNNLEGEDFDGYVCVDGSLAIYDHEVLYRLPIPMADVQRMLRYTEENNAMCFMVTEKDMYVNHINDVGNRMLDLLHLPMPTIADLGSVVEHDPVLQMIPMLPPTADDELRRLLPGCAQTRWTPLFSELVAMGGSKRAGMQAVLQHLGLTPADAIAFGDARNDLEMLSYVGTAIAMGNASDDVKQKAHYVTTNCEDDGIWNALVHLGIIKPLIEPCLGPNSL